MEMLLLFLIVAILIGLLVAGWLYSARTRRLAVLFIIIVIVLAALIGLATLVRVLWFPVGPM